MILGGLFKRFADLLPKPTRQAGVIVAVHGGNEYTVQLAGGGTLRATAATAYGLHIRVFVLGQRIDGLAPALPALVIDV